MTNRNPFFVPANTSSASPKENRFFHAREPMASNEESLHRIVDDVLLGGHVDSVHNFFDTVQRRAEADRLEYNQTAVLTYWWDLARLGMIALPGGKLGAGLLSSLEVVLTERGRALLQRGEESPHDPDRYLRRVRERVPAPDETALTYLAEAVTSWRAGVNRASAVMLGCSCERLILRLAEALQGRDLPPWSDRSGRALSGGRRPASISEVFEIVRDALMHLSTVGGFPGDLRDALDRKLTAVFEHARGLRNRSGHPTGDPVTADDAQAGLLLFPGFHEFVSRLESELLSRTSPRP